MPQKSYRDTQNATILLIILLSGISAIVFTVDYYDDEKKNIKGDSKKYLTISWSIFGSLSFLMSICNRSEKVKQKKPIVLNPGTDIEIVQYPV